MQKMKETEKNYETTQIAHSLMDITPDTKSYRGLLEPGLFNMLPYSVKDVHVESTNEKIRFFDIKLNSGLNTPEALARAITKQKHYFAFDSKWDHKILKQMDKELSRITRIKESELELAILSSSSILSSRITKSKKENSEQAVFEEYCIERWEVYKLAGKMGLEYVPAIAGPLLRLQYLNQPENETIYIGMKPINTRVAAPFEIWKRIFFVQKSHGNNILGLQDRIYDWRYKTNDYWGFLRPKKS